VRDWTSPRRTDRKHNESEAAPYPRSLPSHGDFYTLTRKIERPFKYSGAIEDGKKNSLVLLVITCY
jgi:hypothetical protein